MKPGNILLNTRGEVKISDFGLSAELDSTKEMCATFIGTHAYMSPERLSGKPYSFASDIWSLGITLVECALGQYPYPAYSSSNYFVLLSQIINDAGPSASTRPRRGPNSENRERLARAPLAWQRPCSHPSSSPRSSSISSRSA